MTAREEVSLPEGSERAVELLSAEAVVTRRANAYDITIGWSVDIGNVNIGFLGVEGSFLGEEPSPKTNAYEYAARVNAALRGGVAAFGCAERTRGRTRCPNWCGSNKCVMTPAAQPRDDRADRRGAPLSGDSRADDDLMYGIVEASHYAGSKNVVKWTNGEPPPIGTKLFAQLPQAAEAQRPSVAGAITRVDVYTAVAAFNLNPERRSAASVGFERSLRESLGIDSEGNSDDPTLHHLKIADLSASRPSASTSVAGADGWQLVPVEATQEMMEAGMAAQNPILGTGWWEQNIYQAMLAAAPRPPAAADEREDGEDLSAHDAWITANWPAIRRAINARDDMRPWLRSAFLAGAARSHPIDADEREAQAFEFPPPDVTWIEKQALAHGGFIEPAEYWKRITLEAFARRLLNGEMKNGAKAWRCFYCDLVITNEQDAHDHFDSHKAAAASHPVAPAATPLDTNERNGQ